MREPWWTAKVKAGEAAMFFDCLRTGNAEGADLTRDSKVQTQRWIEEVMSDGKSMMYACPVIASLKEHELIDGNCGNCADLLSEARKVILRMENAEENDLSFLRDFCLTLYKEIERDYYRIFR